MILTLAGTADGREIIRTLKEAGYQVIATAVTPYGAKLAREAGADRVREGALEGEDLAALLGTGKIEAVIDATHPYATTITSRAREICRVTGIPYFRYQRPAVELPAHPNLLIAADWTQAVELASRYGTIMLTIGTRHLELFTAAPAMAGKRIIARVLPEVTSLEKCRQLGLWPGDIIAIQGPCSYELNRALYRQFGVEAVVTKDSGSTGGVESKIQAALDLGLQVIVLRRPPEPDSLPMEEIIGQLQRDIPTGTNY
ncbi:precorrin-6x reductase [Moorella thermoacetica Y72]|uniref:Precorrin-6x reductase n=1 Tax=Moorella thermoacetica Y72 TaxID=1325331 RepID=A0A0S6UH11_NEOTH|nr:precorrin-6A reductase [Moorella thermoacetica]GAF26841.1 precorrin-6x reductase [Moorella thermoacetica Y72]